MKKTIKIQVSEAAETLKSFQTHDELKNWAVTNGMDNRSAFPKFKDALLEIGINYEELRGGFQKAKHEELVSKITHELTLFTDAKASAGRYGICDRNGEVLWYGRFFDNDDAGEQSRAELCAAEKAVWFASKVKEFLALEALRLNLMVDAEWLTYQDHSGQKGYSLTRKAKSYGLDLHVEWIPGRENPADKWTTETGYKKWQDNDLASLALDIKPSDITIQYEG